MYKMQLHHCFMSAFKVRTNAVLSIDIRLNLEFCWFLLDRLPLLIARAGSKYSSHQRIACTGETRDREQDDSDTVASVYGLAARQIRHVI